MIGTILLTLGCNFGIALYMDYSVDESDRLRVSLPHFWIMAPLILLLYTALGALTLAVLSVAYLDAHRRKLALRHVTEMIQYEFNLKEKRHMLVPLIDVLDPKSIDAWLQTCNMCFRHGANQLLRLKVYVAATAAILLVTDLQQLLVAAKILSLSNISEERLWNQIIANLCLHGYILAVLYTLASLNE